MKPALKLKAALCWGWVETEEEIYQTLDDLAAVNCDVVTMGQIPAAYAKTSAGGAFRAS